ncbi:MAG TPA: hypothetical protein VLA52_11450 [Thermohalobaculum sp.]|nr:hypothetical protein [Thermohalobaculum sp.]
MTISDWVPAVTLVSTTVLGLLIVFFKPLSELIVARWVSHRYDHKISELNADLKKQEAIFSSNLENKQKEIDEIRASGFMLFHEREKLKIEKTINSVDKIWAGVNGIKFLQPVLEVMKLLKTDGISEKDLQEEGYRKFFEVSGILIPDNDKIKEKLSNVMAWETQPYIRYIMGLL